MIATLYRTCRILAWLLAGNLLASGCAGPTSKSPGAAAKPGFEATIVAFGRYGGFLSEPGEPTLAAEDLIGTRFYGGDADGPVLPFTVEDAAEGTCPGGTLALTPEQNGIGYSKPAEFFALELASDLWSEVREKGQLKDLGVRNRYLAWRIATRAATGGKVVALAQSAQQSADADAEDRLVYDTLFLFEEYLGTLTLLDSGIWDRQPEDGLVDASILAAAENPFNGHLEMFVRLSSDRSSATIAFDLSADTLQERASYQCGW